MTELPPRLRTLTDSLDDLHLDGMLVTDETNVRYLSGFSGDSSYLLVTPEGTTILSDGRYETQIASECGSLASVIRPPGQLLPDLTQSVLNDLGPKRIGIESDHMTLASYRYFAEKCTGIEFVETSGVVEKLRMIKDECEIMITRQAVRIAERAYAGVAPHAGSGLERAGDRARAGIEDAVSGGCGLQLSADRGGRCGRRVCRITHPGSTLIDDADDVADRLGSELPRLRQRPDADVAPRQRLGPAFGEPTKRFSRPNWPRSKRSARGSRRERSMRLPAASWLELDWVTPSNTGSGTARDCKSTKSPRMSSISDETLASGMIITVEPGVYFEGDFGIRIEDDVLVTETGREVLSRSAKGSR